MSGMTWFGVGAVNPARNGAPMQPGECDTLSSTRTRGAAGTDAARGGVRWLTRDFRARLSGEAGDTESEVMRTADSFVAGAPVRGLFPACSLGCGEPCGPSF